MAEKESKGKYVVLAPLVQLKVKDAAGAFVFRQLYAGAVVDRDEVEVDEANFQAHVDAGQVVEQGADVGKVFAVPAGTPTPGQPPNVAVGETGVAATTAQPIPPLSQELLAAADLDASGDEPWAASTVEGSDGKPDGRASQTTWRDYHAAQLKAQGVPDEDAKASADSMSKADLVAYYRQ